MILNQKIKELFNSIFLVTGACVLCLFLISIRFDKKIDLIGLEITKTYIKHQKEKQVDALNSLARGDARAVVILLEDWKMIQKVDRAFVLKRELFLVLSEYLYGAGKFEELNDWAEIWIDLDDRDITARAYYYESLRHLNGRTEEGVRGLTVEYSRFPKNEALKKFNSKLTKTLTPRDY